MTNKPMLSVELRALLERVVAHDFAEYCQECGIGQSETWKELRALLDKPSCGACGGCDDGCKLDRESPPAAQHQSEPVGYVSPAGLAGATSGKTAMFRSYVVGVYTIPLYAEQPTPVQVPVRPRVDEAEYERMSDYEKGLLQGGLELWDKIDRLNGVKP